MNIDNTWEISYDIYGATGTVGPQGKIGIQGIQGDVGMGPPGVQGLAGLDGLQGLIGAQGIQGLVGDGPPGVQGNQGWQGSIGVQGITETGTWSAVSNLAGLTAGTITGLPTGRVITVVLYNFTTTGSETVNIFLGNVGATFYQVSQTTSTSVANKGFVVSNYNPTANIWISPTTSITSPNLIDRVRIECSATFLTCEVAILVSP